MEEQYARGVSRDRRRKTNPWRASIWVDGKGRYLGSFATKEEAASARRSAVAGIGGRKPRRWMSAIACFEDDRDWVEVELNQGKWAKVDVEDLDKVIGG
jgi:hypothetical protein